MSNSDNDHSVVGRISGVYGVKGWVKITSFTEPAENLFDYSPWRVNMRGGWQTLEIDRRQRHKGAWVAHIVGVDTRDDAEAFKLKNIAVDKSQFADLAGGEFYWHQLIGLRVFAQAEDDTEAHDLGVVHEMLETGANDVLVVRADLHSMDDRERLIPYDPETYVKHIDLEQKKIWVDWNIED